MKQAAQYVLGFYIKLPSQEKLFGLALIGKLVCVNSLVLDLPTCVCVSIPTLQSQESQNRYDNLEQVYCAVGSDCTPWALDAVDCTIYVLGIQKFWPEGGGTTPSPISCSYCCRVDWPLAPASSILCILENSFYLCPVCGIIHLTVLRSVPVCGALAL